MEHTNSFTEYIPIFIQGVVAVGFAVFAMVASHLLGPRRKSKAKLESFECGIESQGDARMPFSIKYFLTAILFVLFDVEVIFMYPWAVNFKEMVAEKGIEGFYSMLLFLGFVVLGFVYIIRKGAVNWNKV